MSIGVVILSYNRPALLRKALQSCREAHEIVVMDDGSGFDVKALCREEWAISNIYCGRYRLPEEHITRPNFGQFLNAGTALLSTPYVAYLCDDDAFAPGWLKAAVSYLQTAEEDFLLPPDVVVGEVIASNGRAFPTLAAGHFCLGNFAMSRGISLIAKFQEHSWSPENHFREVLLRRGNRIRKVDDPALLALQHDRNLSSYGSLEKAIDYYE